MFLIWLAFFGLSGGHWAVFQAVAWAQMVRVYSKSVPMGEAIAKTFGGKYPCDMCVRITTERQKEEQAPAVVKLEKKAEIASFSVRKMLSAPEGRDYTYPRPPEFAFVNWTEAPPVPVPIVKVLA